MPGAGFGDTPEAAIPARMVAEKAIAGSATSA